MERERIWDIVKGILIIFVIIIHSTGGWNYGAWDYYVPKESFNFNYWMIMRAITGMLIGVFFFISGYLMNKSYAEKSIYDYYKKSSKRVVIPYFIWSIIYASINFLIYKRIVTPLSIIIGTNGIQLYFLAVMIQLMILTPLLAKYIKYKATTIICIGITLLNCLYNMWFWINNKAILENEILSFTCWIGYYVFGMYIRNKNLKFQKISFKISILMVAITLILRIIEAYLILNYTNSPVAACSFNSPMNLLYTMAMVIFIYSLKDRLNLKERKYFIEKVGLVCKDIFLIHWIIECILETYYTSNQIPKELMILTEIIEVTITFALSYGYAKAKAIILKKVIHS